MREHSANELMYSADILAADGTATLASGIRAGLEDLAGRLLEQAQLVASETSHMVLFNFWDATVLTESCYLRIEGVLYVVDYKIDPRQPRPNMWLEVYCHVERTNS
jgi:hypothetical protein